MRVLKILLLVLLLAISVSAQDTPADNWSQFRGNHSLTGVSQSNVPTSLKQLWTYEAGDSIESSAVVTRTGTRKGLYALLAGTRVFERTEFWPMFSLYLYWYMKSLNAVMALANS